MCDDELKLKIQIKHILEGHVFLSISDPDESSGQSDTETKSQNRGPDPLGESWGLKPENPKSQLQMSLTVARC